MGTQHAHFQTHCTVIARSANKASFFSEHKQRCAIVNTRKCCPDCTQVSHPFSKEPLIVTDACFSSSFWCTRCVFSVGESDAPREGPAHVHGTFGVLKFQAAPGTGVNFSLASVACLFLAGTD